MKRIPKSVQNVVDVIDYETAAKLLTGGDDKGEDLLFVNIYDAISDTAMNGTPLTTDQQKILLLPFKVWGSDAGRELYKIRTKRWQSRLDPVEARRESIVRRFAVSKA